MEGTEVAKRMLLNNILPTEKS